MRFAIARTFAFILPALLAAGSAAGQDAVKTHEVKSGEFKIEIELSGVFAAKVTEEISVEPESWSQFKVVEAVPHGAKVTAGQQLVRFDDDDYEESLEDAQMDQQLAELAILQAEDELPRLEKSLDLQFEAAQRAEQAAREDFERWQEIDRALSVKSAEFSLKNSRQNLEYQREELEQLQKMYEADDLTEETEEIILKRQRNAVESAEFSYELAQVRHAETLQVRIPRQDAAVRASVEGAELELARARTARELSLNERRFSLHKSKHMRQRSLETHAELLGDRDLFTVDAPIDGVVYYGRAVDGKWSATQSLMESLQPGGSVSPKSVFMTIVQLRPLVVLGTVTEENVVEVDEGAAVTLVPAADDETEIAAEVSEVSAIPVGEGQFSLEVDVTGELPEWVVPGMTCKVKVTTYHKEDAITVPAAAVRTDEEDDEKKYVLVQVEGEDEPERRDVKVGKTHDGKSEVLEGLQAGDVVVLGDAKSTETKDEEQADDDEKDSTDAAGQNEDDQPDEQAEDDEEDSDGSS